MTRPFRAGRPLRQALSALAGAALLLAGGCTAARPAARPPAGPRLGTGSGTITWLAGEETSQVSANMRQTLVDAFEQDYPSITVRLLPAGDSTDVLRATLVQELGSDSPAAPDVYSGDVTWPYEFAKRGLAVPLSTYTRYLPASFWRQFGQGDEPGSGAAMVTAMRYRGAIYAVPYFVDEGFLYYRKDLLARAGLAPPSTWEQLTHDSEVLKAKHLTSQFVWQGNSYEGLTCDFYELLADAYGQLPASGPSSPAQLGALAAELDSPQALKALDFLRQLIASGDSPRDVNTFEEPAADNAFDSGNAAFLRSWDSSYTDAIATLPAADVGVVPPPTFAGQRGPGWSVLGGWSLFVNPHTRSLRADLTFLKWMAGTQAQGILARQFQEIPTIAGVRSSLASGNPVLRAATQTRMISRPAATVRYPQVSAAIYQNVHSALPGLTSRGSDPCTALVKAAVRIDPRVHGSLRCGRS